MKAIRKSDGKVIEVKEWRGSSDVIYSELDMNVFYQASDLDFSVGEVKEAEGTVLSGWVARDSDGTLGIFAVKPERVRYKHNNKNGLWMARTITGLVPEAFPSVTWESEPLAVTITINPKKKLSTK